MLKVMLYAYRSELAQFRGDDVVSHDLIPEISGYFDVPRSNDENIVEYLCSPKFSFWLFSKQGVLLFIFSKHGPVSSILLSYSVLFLNL